MSMVEKVIALVAFIIAVFLYLRFIHRRAAPSALLDAIVGAILGSALVWIWLH